MCALAKFLVITILIAFLMSSIPISSLTTTSAAHPPINGLINDKSLNSPVPSTQRMSYFANFTYLNSAMTNESKLYLKEPWFPAYYGGYLYILGSSTGGYAAIVRTNSSLGDPLLIHIFYQSVFSESDSAISTPQGIYFGIVKTSGEGSLYLYNVTGLHDISNILPGSSWMLSQTYNFTTSNIIFFTKYSNTGTYIDEYNTTSKSSYNLSRQISTNTLINAFYYAGNRIYFVGTIYYKYNNMSGSFPYFGYVSGGKLQNLSNTNPPNYYESLAIANIALSNGTLFFGGLNFTLNDNTRMYFAEYFLNTDTYTTLSGLSGLPQESGVTQIFSSSGNIWIATYNATQYYNMHYVGFYDYNITTKKITNDTYLFPDFFDNFNALLSHEDYLIGWSYLNNTNEIVQFNPFSIGSSLSKFYVDRLGNAYPNFWTGMSTSSRKGFVITGGNGVALENRGTVTSPPAVTYNGFFLDSAVVGSTAYVVGQSYAPSDGVFLYSYNLTSNSMTNITGAFPTSLSSSDASFVQDVYNGSSLIIFGVDSENTAAHPILYSYSISSEKAENLTAELPANLSTSSLYGSDMVQTPSGTYLLTSSSAGLMFGVITGSGYKSLGIPGNGYSVPYSYYYGGFQAMTSDGNTIYIAGNNAMNGDVSLFSYSDATGFTSLSDMVQNYSFQVTSIAYSNGTIYIGGSTSANGANIPNLIAINTTGLYSQSLSTYVPSYFGQITGLSANGSYVFLTGGSFSNVHYGLLKVFQKSVNSITFTSSGLPSGTIWSVSVNGISESSSASTVTFYEPSGTYTYQVGTTPNFASNVSSGSIIISGKELSQYIFIGWIRSAYTVTIQQSGLPTGDLWSFSTSGRVYSSKSGSLSLNLKNGTYGFTAIPPSGFSVTPGHGNFTVSGSNLQIVLYFMKKNAGGYEMYNNDSIPISNDGIFWSGQMISSGSQVFLSGGNGLISASNNGTSLKQIINGNDGYYSFVQASDSSIYIGGNWYMPAGGVTLQRYYEGNDTLQNLAGSLPVSWTTRGTGTSLVSMAEGDSTLFLVESPGGSSSQNLQTGIIKDGQFINLTSRFGSITGRSAVIYGNGTFLLLLSNEAFLYTVSTNSTIKLGNVNPYVSNGVDGAAQFGTFANGSFYFFNGTELSELPSGNMAPRNIATVNSPYFVQNLSGSVYVGNQSGDGTNISVLSGSSLMHVLTIGGQITDMSDHHGYYIVSGTDMQTFSPILTYYGKLDNISLNTVGISGKTWSLEFDNITYRVQSGNVSLVVPQSIGQMTVLPPPGYSTIGSLAIPLSYGLFSTFKLSIPFTKEATYPVDFTENGLPEGQSWNVSVGGFTYSSISGYLNVSLPSGTYSYSIISPSGYVPVPSQGSFTVLGSSSVVHVEINFTSADTYNVVFHENGLLSGTAWNVTLNGQSLTSTGTTAAFNIMKGTYQYTVGSVPGYENTVISGTIDVNGNMTIQAGFLSSSYLISIHETGLPLGTAWSAAIGTSIVQSDTTFLSMSVTNGSYTYTIYSPINYSSNITSGSVQVSGSGASIQVGFTPTQNYGIEFREAGLPSGSTWNVTLNGISMISNTTALTFFMPNGSYEYSIATALTNYEPENAGGSIFVHGSAQIVYVNFTDPSPQQNTLQGAFSPAAGNASSDPVLEIRESGIAFGSMVSQWKVTVDGVSYSSSSSSISINVNSGTLSYRVDQISGYDISPQEGYITAGSANLYLNISFVPLVFNHFVFDPVGIPLGIPVTIDISGNVYTFTPSGTMPFLTLDLPIGTYSYNIASVNGYAPSSSSGTMQLDSNQNVLQINFHSIQYYPVTFTPKGINGKIFEVTIDGNEYISNGTPINLFLSPGVYSYYVSSDSSLKPLFTSGTFNLGPSGYSSVVDFVQQQYLIMFRTSNSFGKQWTLSFDNTTATVIGNYYEAMAPNGTYTYSSQLAGTTIFTEGSVTVSGHDNLVNILFSPTTYYVTFRESGLPTGTRWYVNGTSLSNSSSSGVISMKLPNGNYTFTVTNNSLYYTLNHTIHLTVNENNVTVSVQFQHWAYISGTVLPSNATVMINGNAVAISSGTFNVSVAGGNYTVSATASGFIGFHENLTVQPGTSHKLDIKLTPVHTNSISPNYELYAIIGAVALLVVALVIIFARRR